MAGEFTGGYTRGFSVAGLTFGVNSEIDSSLSTPWDESVAAAKVGQLTTRTSATVGTLTMVTGHGITTGARLDIYWTESSVAGRRYGVTVGTVSVDSVPFSLGTGDNLPTNLTAVTAMVPTELPIVITGDDAVSVAAAASIGPATVVFADSGDAEIYPFLATDTTTNFVWVENQGDNPLAGGSLAKVFISHANSSAAVDMTGCVQYNP